MATQLRAGVRLISTLALALLTGMALVVALALVILTTRIEGAAVSLEEAVASIKLVEHAEIDLLVHARATEPTVRAHIEGRLRRKLDAAARHVSTSREQDALAAARQQFERYFANSRVTTDEQAMQAAHRAVAALVAMNEAQAENARQNVHRWDEVGDRIGVGVGLVMVAVIGGLFWWLRRAVVRPILDLSATMGRFRRGEAAPRAPEAGAAELREMAQQFNAMRDALERQNQQRLVYLAGVAHDLRNPLGALRLSAESIDPAGPLPPEDRIRRIFGITQRQVTRLERMVSDLLEAAQIEAGQLTLQPELVDARDVVRDVAQLFDGTSANHEIVLELAEAPLVVRADPVRLAQTLTNLVSNAIKYSPRGGPVHIVATAEPTRVAIRVTDHGLGMAAGDLEQLWQPFRRGRGDGSIPGAGLGLSIAKRIVDAHDGELAVESTVGTGTTFTVRLPSVATVMTSSATRPASVASRAG